MKEEFKLFVKKRPELINYVNNGKMTWQKFYEQWYLYGEDEAVWSKYKTSSDKFNLSSFIDTIKKVDMNEVQKGISSLQKGIGYVQDFINNRETKESDTKKSSYEPRPIFKNFDD